MKRRDFLKAAAATGAAAALGPTAESHASNILHLESRDATDRNKGALQSSTKFSVQTASGHWSVSSRSHSLTNVISRLNGQSILLNSERKNSTFHKTIDLLEVTAEFAIVNDKWVLVSFRALNPTSSEVHINSFEPLVTQCDGILRGSAAEDLRIMWESATYEVGRARDHESHYYAVVYSDKERSGSAWTFTYRPPQLWTSMISKRGQELTAFVNLRGRSLPVDPGETITFDPILLSAEFGAMEGWQAIGRMYRPTVPSSEAVMNSGFNSWDYFRGEISSKDLAPVLSSLHTFNKEYPRKLRYFTLDDGWFPQRGSWEFDRKKFPEGENGWAAVVNRAGMEPGVWISPFWSNKDIIDTYEMTVQEEVPDNVIRYRVDPSDPNVSRYVIQRFHELRQSGYKFFKIDFLALAYTDRPYAYSKFAPERVIREFLQQIRQAIGTDAFLLGCSTVIAPCSGICDGARIMADITENWSVAKDIYVRVAYRYWMNGNLFITDPDFFVGRGPDTLREGASPGYALETGDRKYEGFSFTKAKTWATMSFALGGLVNWADRPDGVKAEIWNLVATLADLGPGKPGVPLDLMDTEQPTKWLRNSNGNTYIILINTADSPISITLTTTEATQLEDPVSLEDIFTKELIEHPGGDFRTKLNAFDSRCFRVQKFRHTKGEGRQSSAPARTTP